ncbi:tyrosine-protein phosphatase [Gordonia sp. NPDC003424]
MTLTDPGAPSPIKTILNLRDLGGWIGVDGRPVRGGLLFRSAGLRPLHAPDRERFDELGIRTIYDLRSAAERRALPDPEFPDVSDIHLDVLADAPSALPGNLDAYLSDPTKVAEATREFTGDNAKALIAQTYRELVTMGSATDSYRMFFLGLLGGRPVPALFHCTTGKDRTGWAAASFLTLMGVDRDDVYRDYLLTNDRLVPALKPVFDEFARAGGDPDLLHPVLGVDRSYLDASFTEMERTYGTIDGYFTDALGIGPAQQQEMRRMYLATE